MLQLAMMEEQFGETQRDYMRVQQILANELPSLPLGFSILSLIYNRRLRRRPEASASGNFYFLETAVPHATRVRLTSIVQLDAEDVLATILALSFSDPGLEKPASSHQSATWRAPGKRWS